MYSVACTWQIQGGIVGCQLKADIAGQRWHLLIAADDDEDDNGDDDDDYDDDGVDDDDGDVVMCPGVSWKPIAGQRWHLLIGNLFIPCQLYDDEKNGDMMTVMITKLTDDDDDTQNETCAM